MFIVSCAVVVMVKQSGDRDAPGTPPCVRSATCSKIISPASVRGTARSPRCRGERSVAGKATGRSPLSRGRKDLAMSHGVAEATLDQSANCGWATTVNGARDDVALLPDMVS